MLKLDESYVCKYTNTVLFLLTYLVTVLYIIQVIIYTALLSTCRMLLCF